MADSGAVESLMYWSLAIGHRQIPPLMPLLCTRLDGHWFSASSVSCCCTMQLLSSRIPYVFFQVILFQIMDQWILKGVGRSCVSSLAQPSARPWVTIPSLMAKAKQLNQELKTCLYCLIFQKQTIWPGWTMLTTQPQPLCLLVSAAVVPGQQHRGEGSIGSCHGEMLSPDLDRAPEGPPPRPGTDEGGSWHRV